MHCHGLPACCLIAGLWWQVTCASSAFYSEQCAKDLFITCRDCPYRKTSATSRGVHVKCTCYQQRPYNKLLIQERSPISYPDSLTRPTFMYWLTSLISIRSFTVFISCRMSVGNRVPVTKWRQRVIAFDCSMWNNYAARCCTSRCFDNVLVWPVACAFQCHCNAWFWTLSRCLIAATAL